MISVFYELALTYSIERSNDETEPSKLDRDLETEVGTPDFGVVNERLGGAAANDAAGFHDITSIGSGERQIDVLFD